MRIVDTHLHLVYPERLSYPWLDGAPAINKPWRAEDYWREAHALGIEAAIHMEVDVAERDIEVETALVTALEPWIVGAIAACRPEHADFPAYLERAASNPKVKGLRRVLHTMPDDLSQSDLFAENIRRLPDFNLSFDLCVRADQLPQAIALAQKAPDTQFILDHCGVPNVAEQALDPWREHISELARLPNVAGKISGIVAYAGPDWSVDTLRPFVDHMIDSFGWDRLVWGSDHPVCTLTANLTRWVEATRELIAGASAFEQSALLHRNAERIYRL